jgi:hypothetical protein
MRGTALYGVFFGAILCLSCKVNETENGDTMEPAHEAKLEVRRDIDGLAQLVDLPSGVESVRWVYGGAPGEESRYLVATLYLSAKQVAEIQEKSTPTPLQGKSYLGLESARLVLDMPHYSPSEEYPEHAAIEGQTYDPDFFTKSKKSRFLSGLVTVLNGQNIVLLNLYAM